MPEGKLNIPAARTRPWTTTELLLRQLWSLCSLLFRFSPRFCFFFRVWLLRLFGAKIGKGVNIYPSVKVAIPWNLSIDDWSTVGDGVHLYNLGLLKIGTGVTISQEAYICGGTHNHSSASLPLIKAEIVLSDYSWICARAFVGPFVKVGIGAIVGANAVLVKDCAPWAIVAGNPCKEIGMRNLK